MFIRCKYCEKKFFLGFGFGHHLLKAHDVDITPNDERYIRKRRLRFCLLPFILLGKGLRLVLICICFPFHYLYELLTYEI
jgi:hypothetical protein